MAGVRSIGGGAGADALADANYQQTLLDEQEQLNALLSAASQVTNPNATTDSSFGGGSFSSSTSS